MPFVSQAMHGQIGGSGLSDGSEADSSGRLNSLQKRAGSGPSPSGTAEQRSPVPAEQAPSDVFKQEQTGNPARLLTPQSRGQTISVIGEGSDRQEVGSQEHTVSETSAAWWNEQRIKNNPARKGESAK